MAEMVDIEVILDKKYTDPKVLIYTASESEQVEGIKYAIENAARTMYAPILVSDDGCYRVISQRDIYRIRTNGREVILDTADGSHTGGGTLAKYEHELDEERFFRISQSEIINLYKVKSFDFNLAGTVGVEFDNGIKSWVARRCVKPLRDKLRESFGKAM